MTLPFPLPNWMPWWVPLAILVPALLYALVFLLMPFSVFGLKGRLESLDERLDEIQGEIRALVLRLPEPGFRREEAGADLVIPRPVERPPIPPEREPERPVADADLRSRLADSSRARVAVRETRPARAEPRLDWPR